LRVSLIIILNKVLIKSERKKNLNAFGS